MHHALPIQQNVRLSSPLNRMPIRLLMPLHLLLFLLRLIITPLILLLARPEIPYQNFEDEVEPEQIDALQHGEQYQRDGVADPALVLFGFPVELVGYHGGELVGRAEAETEGEERVDDAQVDEVAEVAPDEHEAGEVGDCEGVFDVVEEFGCLHKRSVLVAVEGEGNWLTARKKSEMSWVR